MSEEKEFKIPVDSLFGDFENHLKQKSNKRILFSAKFGTGKTYFLNEFFDAHSNEYEVFHLYPVNYQISSNESILEFIRYDLLIQLLDEERKITFKDEESYGLVDTARALHIWGTDQNNFAELLKLLPKVGQTLSQASKLYAKFEKSKSLLEAGDKGLLENYLDRVSKLDEPDPQSKLIREKVDSIKEKEKILIIDDLDRIDPEHIFRILNVFSAHFAQSPSEEDNLFRFDKVILVADVENLRSIFHHRYGEKTDFSGYIDKFYSSEVYDFSLKDLLGREVRLFLRNIIEGRTNYFDSLFSQLAGLQTEISEVKFRVTFRQLLKYYQNDLSTPAKPFQRPISGVSSSEIDSLMVARSIHGYLYFLKSIFGNCSKEFLKELFTYLAFNEIDFDYHPGSFDSLLKYAYQYIDKYLSGNSKTFYHDSSMFTRVELMKGSGEYDIYAQLQRKNGEKNTYWNENRLNEIQTLAVIFLILIDHFDLS